MQFIKRLAPLFLIMYLGLPLFVWGSQTELGSLTGFGQIVRSIGQVSGLLGMSLFCLNFVLAARIRFIEDLLSGLNRVYLLHHLVGEYALIFLIFHPLFLALQYLPLSVLLVVRFFLPPIISDFATWFGILALCTLIVLLVLTLYIKLEYQFWRFTHQLLGTSLFLAALHVLFISGDLTIKPALRWYMLGLSVTALLAFAYRTLFWRLLVKRYSYTVTEVIHKSDDVSEIKMTPDTASLPYWPGQFVFVEIISALGIRHEVHPFSITSPVNSTYLAFAAKSSGDYTETLKLLKPHTQVKVEGAYGRFLLERARPKQIWIAGGIGITPFLSLARNLTPSSPYQIALIYSVKTRPEAVYMDEFNQIAATSQKLQIFVQSSREQGRLTAHRVAELVPDLKERDIFLCGPPPMMQSMRSQLRELGVRNSHIHSEEFNLK